MIRKQISLLAALWLTTALAGAQPVYYIIGTFHSNGVNESAENPFYRYYPTAYFSIRQQYGDRCDRCRNLHFLYSNPSYPPNKNYWAILNDGIFMTPCLLPIVGVQDE